MIAAVTGVVAILRPHLPVLSLLVLYLLAVLPVALRWGAGPAAAVAVLSTVAFGYLFLPLNRQWWIAEARNVVALGVFVVTAVVVGNLAARLRRAAQEAARLTDAQSALRRLATLAARGAEPDRLFAAVVDEVGEFLGADVTAILRFETDATMTVLGGGGWPDTDIATAVRRTGRPARLGHAAVASPVAVQRRLWGAIAVASRAAPLPPDTEDRLADFAEIVAIAIANTESRAELAASRARVIAAGDATRRRLERDLHDGAQQRLVSLALELRAVEAALPDDRPDLRADVARLANELTEALDDLRELSRGIHPAILSEGGLGPALRTLGRRAGVPVEVDVRTRVRFPEPVEVAAYYVVSEAVTNTTKHAGASYAEVVVSERDGGLWLCVRDDGAGGADPRRGSGLTGLRDRVEALGGSIRISSPAGDGTSIEVFLPLRAV
jgi:signal transduction histidine kinase